MTHFTQQKNELNGEDETKSFLFYHDMLRWPMNGRSYQVRVPESIRECTRCMHVVHQGTISIALHLCSHNALARSPYPASVTGTHFPYKHHHIIHPINPQTPTRPNPFPINSNNHIKIKNLFPPFYSPNPHKHFNQKFKFSAPTEHRTPRLQLISPKQIKTCTKLKYEITAMSPQTQLTSTTNDVHKTHEFHFYIKHFSSSLNWAPWDSEVALPPITWPAVANHDRCQPARPPSLSRSLYSMLVLRCAA